MNFIVLGLILKYRNWDINYCWTTLRKISFSVSSVVDKCLVIRKFERNIIDLRDSSKSRYFVLFYYQVFFSYLNYSVTAQGSELPFFAQESYYYLRAEYYFQVKFRRYNA